VSTVAWVPLSKKHVEQLRCLNADIFPVKYNDKFCAEAPASPVDLVRLAFIGDQLVGAVCCRKECPPAESSDTRVYIMTLGVLAPYRDLGIGRGLLDHFLAAADTRGCAEVYLHVQVGNDDALALYEHFGFSVKEFIPNYYKRMQPADCFYVYKLYQSSPPQSQPSGS
jgi:N-alpha-acetyltransferase 50